MEFARRHAERGSHSQRPVRHAELYYTPIARDRSNEQLAPPRAYPAPRRLMPQDLVGPPGCPYRWRYRCPGRTTTPQTRPSLLNKTISGFMIAQGVRADAVENGKIDTLVTQWTRSSPPRSPQQPRCSASSSPPVLPSAMSQRVHRRLCYQGRPHRGQDCGPRALTCEALRSELAGPGAAACSIEQAPLYPVLKARLNIIVTSTYHAVLVS